MRSFRILATAIVAASLAGCAALEASFCTPYCNSSQHSSSSLVEFLYPNGQVPPADNSIPELHVPLKSGPGVSACARRCGSRRRAA